MKDQFVGQIFDDYKINRFIEYRHRNAYYEVECLICGHIKECGKTNILKQNNHHSQLNCKMDYYKPFIGMKIGDYLCIDIVKERVFLLVFKCQICGHILKMPECELKKRNNLKHTPDRCGIDYYENEVGKIYGDFKILEITYKKHGCTFANCQCIKCGEILNKEIHIIQTKKFKHGLECFKSIKDSVYKNIFAKRFNNMKQRCTNNNNENYHYYGEQNIRLLYEYPVDLYHDFIDEFKKHAAIYGIRNTTFDRIDVNGNYEKNNLRLTTQTVQSTNTTRCKLYIIQKNQEIVLFDSCMEAGRQLGLNGRALGNLIRKSSRSCGGWSLVDIFDYNINNENITKLVNKYKVTKTILVTRQGDEF